MTQTHPVFRSAAPFASFVILTVTLSFWSSIHITLLVAAGLLCLLLGSLLAADRSSYWANVTQGLGQPTAMTAVLLWLIVGVYGNILKEGHLVEGLVWASHRMVLSPSLFTLAVFLFSSVFAVSTGSGFGTINAMSLTLYPAGIALGADSALLGGAILSGAALGDSIAPVSDTAVIAATSQEDDKGQTLMDIGSTVRHRLPFVFTAFLITSVAFLLSGHLSDAPARVCDALPGERPDGLALLLPTFAIIALSLFRVHFFTSLAVGLALAVGIGLGLDLFGADQLLCLRPGRVGGAVIDGIANMADICILLMVVVALAHLLVSGGAMQYAVRRLNAQNIRSPRRAELLIFSLVSLAGILIAAVNTIANICIAPFVNSIGRNHALHPLRRTTILATVICTYPFFLPYGGCVLLLQKGVAASGAGTALLPTDVFFTAFFPWILLIIMLIACLSGYRRNPS